MTKPGDGVAAEQKRHPQDRYAIAVSVLETIVNEWEHGEPEEEDGGDGSVFARQIETKQAQQGHHPDDERVLAVAPIVLEHKTQIGLVGGKPEVDKTGHTKIKKAIGVSLDPSGRFLQFLMVVGDLSKGADTDRLRETISGMIFREATSRCIPAQAKAAAGIVRDLQFQSKIVTDHDEASKGEIVSKRPRSNYNDRQKSEYQE